VLEGGGCDDLEHPDPVLSGELWPRADDHCQQRIAAGSRWAALAHGLCAGLCAAEDLK
jgi:hypothetical protein